jgi:phosphohistidine phosphatase SixA
MMLVPALFALAVSVSPPDSLLSADSLLVELRKGGYTILWRHTATDHSVREPQSYENTPRFQQRNLTDRGIADAKLVGMLFKRRDIPIGDVLSSPMFRTRETAEYAFGRVEATPILRQLDPTPEQRRLIATAPAAGTNRVLVTHHFIIERNVPGIRPGQITEGEAVVVRATGPESVQAVGIFKMADWARLGGAAASATPSAVTSGHGGAGFTLGHGAGAGNRTVPTGPPRPLVIPPALETSQTAAIAEYLEAFNAGDVARMRRFYETRVVPNPDRTIEQRMEVYTRLRADLGTLAIDSVDASDPANVSVKVQASTGPIATVLFSVEPQSPYRLRGISFRVGG